MTLLKPDQGPTTPMRRPPTALAPIVLASSLMLAGCGEPPKPNKEPRVVETLVVAPAGGATSTVYSGQVVSRYEGRYGFRVAGMIVAKLVDVGETVSAGQVLARLDPTDVELNASGADAQVSAAAARAGPQSVDLARARQLAREGFISPAELDQQRSAAQQAGAQLRVAQAQRASASRQVSYTALRAERSGVVTSFQGDVGQVVPAGQPVVTVATPGAIEAAISIPEGDVAALRASSLRVQLWSDPAVTYAGRIRTLSPAANPQTRTFDAKVSFDAPATAAPIGSTAQVVAQQAVAGQSLRGPVAAVTRRDGRAVVAVVTGTPARVTFRPVQVTAVQDNAVLLSSGLRPGDRIVTAGVQLLQAGEIVRAVPSTAERAR